jgi:hypothetical protein
MYTVEFVCKLVHEALEEALVLVVLCARLAPLHLGNARLVDTLQLDGEELGLVVGQGKEVSGDGW